MENRLYANYTISFRDYLLENPNCLDFIKMKTVDRSNILKDMIKNKYFDYEIGGETPELFQMYLETTFNLWYKYYDEILDIYENNKYTPQDLIKSSSITSVIDLPNKQTNSEYVSNKTKVENSNNSLLLDNRNQILSSIRNIYLEFTMKFNENFIQIFYTGGY